MCQTKLPKQTCELKDTVPFVRRADEKLTPTQRVHEHDTQDVQQLRITGSVVIHFGMWF